MSTVRELVTKILFAVDKSGLKQAENTIKNVKNQLAQIGDAGAKAGSAAANGLRQVSSAADESAKRLDRMVNTGIAIGESFKRGLREARDAARGFGGAWMDNFRGKSPKELRSMGKDAMSLGAERMAMGTALLAPLYVPVKAAMTFESGMADIRKVVDFESDAEYKKMASDISALSLRIPVAVEGLQSIVAAGGQSGIEKENLLAFAEAAAKMGVAFDISMEDAGQQMASWRAGMNLSQAEVEALGDKINLLGNTTAASSPKIAEFITRVGSFAKVAGMAEGVTSALGATIIAAGTEPDIAATAVQNMVLALSSGESASKKQKAALQELGFEAEEMAKYFHRDAEGAVLAVLRGLKGLEPYRQTSVMEDIFGRESIKGLSKTISNLESLENNFRKVGDASQYAGSMQKEFDQRAATTEYSLQRLRNHIDELSREAGAGLLPVVEELSNILMPIIKTVTEFVKENPKLVTGIMLVVAAIGGLLFVLGGLGVAVGGITTLIGLLPAGFVAAIAAAGPWIAALVVIGGLLYAIYTHWDEIVSFITTHATAAWEKLKEVATACLDAIIGLIDNAINKVKDFFAALGDGLMSDRLAEINNNKVDEWERGSGGSNISITQNNRIEGYKADDVAQIIEDAGDVMPAFYSGQ